MRKKIFGWVLLGLFILLITQLILAEVKPVDYNKSELTSDARLAYEKILDNEAQVLDLNSRGIGTIRINDEIFIARQLFENAYERQKNGQFADYSRSLAQSNTTSNLIRTAFNMQDELTALKEEIESLKGSINTEQVIELYSKAETEFKDQRFEKTMEYIDAAYAKISELQSVQARSQAMFSATQKSFENFIAQNGTYLGIILVLIIIFYLLFRKKISLYILNRAYAINELEINVLKEEIKQTQSDYFVKGKMAEGTYHIRTKIYGDKIRELNKKNALISEQISEITGSIKKRGKKFEYKEDDKK